MKYKMMIISMLLVFGTTGMLACGNKIEMNDSAISQETESENQETVTDADESGEIQKADTETEAEKEKSNVASDEKEDAQNLDESDAASKEEETATEVEESEETEDTVGVTAMWGDSVETAEIVYEEFIMDNSDWKTKVYFAAAGTAREFKLLSLMTQDVDANGKPSFEESVLYEYGDLEDGKGLMASLVFYGDLPEYGYSYLDEKGTLHKYYMEISGEDGSLLTTSYE